MNPIFKNTTGKDYITHTMIGGERIIPSDSFELDDNRYVLLKIMQSTDDILFLKLICVEGPDLGNIYLIPKTLFEDQSISEIQASLKHYQH